MFCGHPDPCEQMWAGAQAASKLLAKLGSESRAAALSWQPLRENTACHEGGRSARDGDPACQGSKAVAVCSSEPTCPLRLNRLEYAPPAACKCNGSTVLQGWLWWEWFTYSLPSANSHLWDKVECPYHGMRRQESDRISLLRTARSAQLHPGALDKASAQGMWHS